ncbi:MAG TPA: 16S rRNA (cytosine(1402)-N(4))-methyltransferase RsmH [Patescibacteria group bacterium]|nr:16S rRNA (cytosine(1402)-N(4))-methyltransferase RsmH [Patescibacteria group bacterium]
MNNYHVPVLLQEVLQYLEVEPDKVYIDGTVGGGGHTEAMLAKGASVLGIDVDQEAIEYVTKKTIDLGVKSKDRLTLARGNFGEIEKIAKEHKIDKVDGVLLDLGVSSHQLDTSERGFSFVSGPLDMRMSEELQVKAADLVNGLTEKELVELFGKFGEEPYAHKIAKAIITQRKRAFFTRTDELAELIKRTVHNHDAIHPATRVFQALRIAVNDELYVLQTALPRAFALLKPGGRLVVISFHSLEDRIVKQTLQTLEQEKKGKILTPKPVTASESEVLQNRRARSAKLRAIEKL